MKRSGSLRLLSYYVVGCSVSFAPASGSACGYEDPQTVALGALNFAYPDALHVGTAVWQAEMDGLLQREAPPAAQATPKSFATPVSVLPTNVNTSPSVALVEALLMIEQLRGRLSTDSRIAEHPAVAMVFASKMLWTRFQPGDGAIIATPHANGPESGDVVLVTEANVVRGLVSGTFGANLALDRGLIRMYGDPVAVDAVRQWLSAVTPTRL